MTEYKTRLHSVHRAIHFCDTYGNNLTPSCRGCGQRYPCDAVRAGDAIVTVLESFHGSVEVSRGCDSDRCVAMVAVIDMPQESNIYPEDDPD